MMMTILLMVVVSVDATANPSQVVSNYAKYLAQNNCTAWAMLFSSNGCKIDKPAPSCGYAQLVKFCQAGTQGSSLVYGLNGPTIVSKVESTYYVLAGFLLAVSTPPNGLVAQTGYNSFQIDVATGKIVECIGYLGEQVS